MRITERRLREVIRSVIVESSSYDGDSDYIEDNSTEDYDGLDYVADKDLAAWKELSQREDTDDARLLRDFCRYMGISCDNDEISKYINQERLRDQARRQANQAGYTDTGEDLEVDGPAGPPEFDLG